ncbi:hypothetical protein R1sor_020837 [Riccia sorocarpa]|uniref:Fungal N-terminal domain-containing protein n=1 Tax=Riccia sorocarpa TaxID=122646 RepID=A0ABD3GH06_9MARC
MATFVAGFLIPELISQLTAGITQLTRYLAEVRTIKKHNKLIVEEIQSFVHRLETNLELVKTKLPPEVSGVALGTLVRDMDNANQYMEECLAQGKFKKYWNATETRDCLDALRQKLMASFQMAFLVTSLDAALEGHRSTRNFQGVMVELFQAQMSDSAAAQEEMRNLFRPLVSGQDHQNQRQDEHMQKQEQLMQTVTHSMADIRAILDQIATRQEDGVSEKFLNDVATAIRQSLTDLPGESSRIGTIFIKESTDASPSDASTHTEVLNNLRAENSQLKASLSVAKQEAREKISSLAGELESEKEKNAALSIKLKAQITIAMNQVTTLGKNVQVARRNGEDLLSLSAELARKSSENAQVITELTKKLMNLEKGLVALGSQLEEVESPDFTNPD